MLKRELQSLLNAEGRSPLADLKYLRVSQVPRRYPISRALLYQWLNDGKIKSVLIPGPGGIRGVRFILASSIEDFLERLAEEQKDEGFSPGRREGIQHRATMAVNPKDHCLQPGIPERTKSQERPPPQGGCCRVNTPEIRGSSQNLPTNEL